MRAPGIPFRLLPILSLSALLAAASAPLAADTAAARSAAERAVDREPAARWLSQQLHHPVEASQVLTAPDLGSLEGCVVTRLRPAPTRATALSLRCPAQPLPQLVLLKIELDAASAGLPAPAGSTAGIPAGPRLAAIRQKTVKAPPLVRAGAELEADWRTPSLHAQLPVVALGPGAEGDEIRVRVAQSNRVFRARIVDAHSVSVVSGGA